MHGQHHGLRGYNCDLALSKKSLFSPIHAEAADGRKSTPNCMKSDFLFRFPFHRARAFTTPALWSRKAKNTDCSTGPLAHPFTRSLAPHYSLRSRALLHSLVRWLAHFAHSLARGKVIY